jgi:acyl-CoA reductase-like NAD-dependent aldehyde dehydrogenase
MRHPLVTAVRLSDSQRLDVENPAAFVAIVGRCRPACIDDLDRCIEAAVGAQHAWALLPAADRWQLLAAAADNVPPTPPLERTLVGETGEVRAEARAELEMCLPLVRSYRRLAAEWGRRSPGGRFTGTQLSRLPRSARRRRRHLRHGTRLSPFPWPRSCPPCWSAIVSSSSYRLLLRLPSCT